MKAVSFSLRTKIILVTLVSLLISSPISAFIDSLIRNVAPHLRLGVYVNTIISLIVTTTLITICIQFVAIRPLKLVSAALRKIAEGQFMTQVDVKSKDEIGQLGRELNHMVDDLRGLLSEVSDTSHQLAASSEELATSAEQGGKASGEIALTVQTAADGAKRQFQDIERSTQIFTGISDGVHRIVEKFEVVSGSVNETTEFAVNGSRSVERVIDQMESIHRSVNQLANDVRGLGERSKEIEKMVDTITQIAAQTNLLALNAAIEAARAGEHGRGFSVVADEVRKLAEQSAGSAKQIAELVATIQSDTNAAVGSMEASTGEVATGIETVHNVNEAFGKIQSAVHDVSDRMDEVSQLVHQISSGNDQLQNAMQEVSAVASTTAAGMQTAAASSEEQLATVEETTAAISSVAEMAERLQSVIGRFSI